VKITTTTTTTTTTTIIIIQLNSVQFNSSLLMCQFYSQKANYRISTTQIITDSEQNTDETDTVKSNIQHKRIFKYLIK
jgi:hypothetical protein